MGYSVRVGERLRTIRLQRGMSLQDVHRTTDGEFKAAVLGAYERGERSLSLPRLKRLAGHYEVPVSQLLPVEDSYELSSIPDGSVSIDLRRVDALDAKTSAIIERFLQRIQIQRQDFNGRVLTIRASDVAMLAMMLDVADVDLVAKLSHEDNSP
ncbi:MAG: transcriptional regulator [Actinobacteria bacterium]|nr:MAG: transcriptional regulator [Actinomycetota bacterium]